MVLGYLMAAAGVQAKGHRVRTQEDPEPPAIPRLAFLVDEDHPARLVSLGEGRLGVACQQSFVQPLKQRLKAFQTTGHRARRQVQAQQTPVVQQPLGGRRIVKKKNQDLHPHRDAQQSLGNELGGGRSGERSGTVGAGARAAVASSPDQASIRPHLDLDLFGILRVTGGQKRTAAGANSLVLGQLAEFLNDRQMAVITPWRARSILPLASFPCCGKLLLVIFAFEVIRAIPGRGFLALSTEELVLEPAIFTAKLLDLGFKVLGTMDGPSMLSLPISSLLPQLEILTPQVGDFLSQLSNFAPQLPDQLGKSSRHRSQLWAEKRVLHDANACNPSLASRKRSTSPRKRFGRSFTKWPPGTMAVILGPHGQEAIDASMDSY